MGHIKPLLLAWLALNVYHVLCDPNERLLAQMVDRKITFPSTNNFETCNMTQILPSEDKYHQALGYMRGLHVMNVTWHIPLYNKEDKMADVYRRLDVIAKKTNAKYHLSKFDALFDLSIPFYFRAIRYSGVKFYATLTTTPLTSIIRASKFENVDTKLKMLSANDIVAFATQMVKTVKTLHEIEFALGPIEPQKYAIWRFVGADGKQQKRFIPTDLKSTKERTKELVKTNWLEVLATIAEVMGAYDRSKESKDTGYKKKFNGWVFPSKNLQTLMRKHLTTVNTVGVLDGSFVENLKTHVEEWAHKTFGQKDAKSTETHEVGKSSEVDDEKAHFDHTKMAPRMRTKRRFSPTYRGDHYPSYQPAYRLNPPKGYHSMPNFGRSPMPRADREMAPHDYYHDHDGHDH